MKLRSGLVLAGHRSVAVLVRGFGMGLNFATIIGSCSVRSGWQSDCRTQNSGYRLL